MSTSWKMSIRYGQHMYHVKKWGKLKKFVNWFKRHINESSSESRFNLSIKKITKRFKRKIRQGYEWSDEYEG